MTILNKIKWTASLLVVFLLILATNLIDQDHFRNVRQSIVTIYEDRLVVKDYIYDLAMVLSDKHFAIATNDLDYLQTKAAEDNEAMFNSVDKFYQTKLTKDERKILDSFSKKLQEFIQNEKILTSDINMDKSVLTSQIASLKRDLQSLSDIQMKEGKKQLSIANRSVNSIDMFTRIEIIALVIIGIVFQIVILYKPKSTI
jgi:hypothetical protein